ncbi:hypothetical protein K0M31_011015 [Melipona bicolor]|uniref:Uncharacterized protein n=1 Tax=Melipona bicolor TaxID=60889 RepID=A0AA40KHZ0_9HYME|nr:hypothetical protein K0M31_011015 [Melipona bicolor]
MAEKLREAAARGDVARVARLLDEDIKPLPDENGRSPLSLAAAAGHVDVCETLLLRKVDVNAADNRTQYDTDTVSSEDNDSLERAEKAIGIVSVIVQEDPAGYEIGHNASIAALTDGQSSLPSFAAEHVWLAPASKGYPRGGCI